MKKCVTIPELCKNHNLHPNSVRWLINNAKLKKQSFTKKELNGFTGHLYLKSECEKVISEYFERKKNEVAKEKEEELNFVLDKSYDHGFICMILRPHNVNSLSGKLVKDWNFEDWKNFEKLKNEKLKSIQVNY